jgi:hypothetical protein
MEFEFTWVEPSLLLCRAWGTATVEGITALEKALISHPKVGPGVYVLADHTDLDPSAITAAEIYRMAEFRAQNVHGIGVRVAIVSGPDPLRYGLERMFASFAEPDAEGMLRIFQTREEAIAWLTEWGAQIPPELADGGTV